MSSPFQVPDVLSRQRKRRPLLWRLIRATVIGYVLLVIVSCNLQERLLFPGCGTQGKPEAQVQARPGAQLVELTTRSGVKTVALFGPALLSDGSPHPHPETCPTLLYFYGNAMCVADTEWEFQEFRQLRANVMIPEYVGFGMAGGKPSEQGCYETAEAALAWLASRPEVDRKRIVVAGWSLGAAVACETASGPEESNGRPAIAGLAMFSAFTSVDAVAHHHYWFMPTSLLLRHHFRSIEKIGKVKGPVLLGHGSDDRIIPQKMSLELKAAARQAANLWYVEVPGANHNDFYSLGGSSILRAMDQWLDAVRASGMRRSGREEG